MRSEVSASAINIYDCIVLKKLLYKVLFCQQKNADNSNTNRYYKVHG